MIGFPRPGQSYYQFAFRIDDLTAVVVDLTLQYFRRHLRDPTEFNSPTTPLTYTQDATEDLGYFRRHLRDVELGD